MAEGVVAALPARVLGTDLGARAAKRRAAAMSEWHVAALVWGRYLARGAEAIIEVDGPWRVVAGRVARGPEQLERFPFGAPADAAARAAARGGVEADPTVGGMRDWVIKRVSASRVGNGTKQRSYFGRAAVMSNWKDPCELKLLQKLPRSDGDGLVYGLVLVKEARLLDVGVGLHRGRHFVHVVDVPAEAGVDRARLAASLHSMCMCTRWAWAWINAVATRSRPADTRLPIERLVAAQFIAALALLTRTLKGYVGCHCDRVH